MSDAELRAAIAVAKGTIATQQQFLQNILDGTQVLPTDPLARHELFDSHVKLAVKIAEELQEMYKELSKPGRFAAPSS